MSGSGEAASHVEDLHIEAEAQANVEKRARMADGIAIRCWIVTARTDVEAAKRKRFKK